VWQPSEKYPDPRIEILDERFAKYRLFNAGIEKLAEGPVWFGDGRYLLVSDIPNDRIMRWDEPTGAFSVYRQGSRNGNGNFRDLRGRLVTCEHEGRRVTRTEHDGAITVLADSYGGKRLNSPNDVVVKSDGSIWFTDPPFGLGSWYEGRVAQQELPANVYRIDGETGELSVVLEGTHGPNGLCFSPDERILYLVQSRATPNRLITAHEVSKDGRALGMGRTVIDCGAGTSDGIRCDMDGNLWCGWGMGSDELDGVAVFAPDGKQIGHIHLPERCANLCFGGRHRNRLFMAAGKSLFALYVNVQGAGPAWVQA
jgi:gluconolactonase